MSTFFRLHCVILCKCICREGGDRIDTSDPFYGSRMLPTLSTDRTLGWRRLHSHSQSVSRDRERYSECEESRECWGFKSERGTEVVGNPNRRDPYLTVRSTPPPADAFTQDHTVQSEKG